MDEKWAEERTEGRKGMTKAQILRKIRALRNGAHSKADLPLLILERWLKAKGAKG